jgi:hypothetical protein
MSYAGLCTTGDRFLDRTQTIVCDESIDMAGLDKAILKTLASSCYDALLQPRGHL